MRRAVSAVVLPLTFLAASVAAQQVTESTLPLADKDVSGFTFRGDVALAFAWDGNKEIDAKISAFDLAKNAPLWHQVVRVQQKPSEGPLWVVDSAAGRLTLGHGPLTVLDMATGRTIWSLDCKAIGSVDIRNFMPLKDGSFLAIGSQECGDDEKLRISRIDDATGKVLWQVPAETHHYKKGDHKYNDFAMRRWTAAGDATKGAMPTVLVLLGEDMQGVDLATGKPAWAAVKEPGRFVDVPGASLALFVDDDEKLSRYGLKDGAKQWTIALGAPFPLANKADPAAGDDGDIILFTFKGAQRIDATTGAAKWSFQREYAHWGQALVGPIAMVANAKGQWVALDAATGRQLWAIKMEPGKMREVEEGISVAATGTVVVSAYEGLYMSSRVGPWVITGFDAQTGAVKWKVDKVGKEEIQVAATIDSTSMILSLEHGGLAFLDVRTGEVIRKPPPAGAKTLSVADVLSGGGGFAMQYSAKEKSLTCVAPDGSIAWTRKGEKSEEASVAVLEGAKVAIWPTKDGKVELIALATGASLHTVTVGKNPVIGVDEAHDRVLVAQGETLKVLTVTR